MKVTYKKKFSANIYRLLSFKIKAGVLVYTLVISILTLVFLLGFLQLFLLSNKEKLILMSEDKKEDILQSGIEFLLSANLNCTDTILKITLFENDEHEHYLKQERFGLFDIITSTLVWGGDTLNKNRLIANCKKSDQTCLIIGSSPFSLKIGGDALLEGDVELSEKGIERAYVGGKSYIRDSLVYGNTKLLNHSIPELTKEIAKINSKNFINFSRADIFSYSNEIAVNQKRNFNQTILLIASKNEMNIDSDSIAGKCVIKSEKSITIGENAFLENVIISAPKIFIEDNFEGCIQLIASDTIIIGKNVKLRYPSAVFINQSESTEVNPLLEIEEDTKIQGLVIIIQSEKVLQKHIIMPVLSVGLNADITGQVYSTGNVYHRGSINGSLVCKQLIDLSSGVNESLLIDGKISKRKMPSFFPEFGIWSNDNQKTILKCLE